MATASDVQPTTYNLVITRGETYIRPFLWQTGTPLAPVNLTGYSARMQIRPEWVTPGITPDVSLISLTNTNGITLGDAAGTITVTISDTLTAALTVNSGVYDLELISPGGTVTKFLRGKVTVLPEATV